MSRVDGNTPDDYRIPMPHPTPDYVRIRELEAEAARSQDELNDEAWRLAQAIESGVKPIEPVSSAPVIGSTGSATVHLSIGSKPADQRRICIYAFCPNIADGAADWCQAHRSYQRVPVTMAGETRPAPAREPYQFALGNSPVELEATIARAFRSLRDALVAILATTVHALLSPTGGFVAKYVAMGVGIIAVVVVLLGPATAAEFFGGVMHSIGYAAGLLMGGGR